MAAAWQILKQDPHMLLLPIASSACLMLLTVSWAIPTLFGGFSGPTWPATMHTTEAISSIGAFVFYITTYAVVIFFNAALACCVLRKFEGKPVSIFAGLQEAAGLFPQVLGWAQHRKIDDRQNDDGDGHERMGGDQAGPQHEGQHSRNRP